MKRHSFLALAAVLACVADAPADSVLIRNTSGVHVEVAVREYWQRDYRTLPNGLFNEQGTRINVQKMPFYVAVSTNGRSYVFLGPFDHATDGASEIVLDREKVFESLEKEVRVRRGFRRWECVRVPIKRSRMIPIARVRGLTVNGMPQSTIDYSPSEPPIQQFNIPASP